SIEPLQATNARIVAVRLTRRRAPCLQISPRAVAEPIEAVPLLLEGASTPRERSTNRRRPRFRLRDSYGHPAACQCKTPERMASHAPTQGAGVPQGIQSSPETLAPHDAGNTQQDPAGSTGQTSIG